MCRTEQISKIAWLKIKKPEYTVNEISTRVEHIHVLQAEKFGHLKANLQDPRKYAATVSPGTRVITGASQGADTTMLSIGVRHYAVTD